MNAAPHESTSKVSPMQVSPKADERSRVCFPPRAEFGHAPSMGSKRCAVLCWCNRELRAAEDRINRLEREVALFRDRAARAEGWLPTIYKEIEEKLIAPRSAAGTEQNLVSPSNPNNSEKPDVRQRLPP
jgi:hypothetical protein